MKLVIPDKNIIKPNLELLEVRSFRYWIMSEVEAQFDANGILIGFKVIRSFKRQANEDKKSKEEKEENKQRKINVEEDEVL